MKRKAVLTLGMTALLPTVTLVCLDIAIATHDIDPLAIRIASVASAALETVALISLSLLLRAEPSPTNSWPLILQTSTKLTLALASTVLLCLSAAAASVVTALLLRSITGNDTDVPGIFSDALVISYSAIVGISFICQLAFSVLCYVKIQRSIAAGMDVDTDSESQPYLKSAWKVKTVPYRTTRVSEAEHRGVKSFESTSMTSFRGRTSPTLTSGSPRSSFSQPGRSSSQRRLVSLRQQQPASADDGSHRASVDTTDSLGSTYNQPRWLQTLEAPAPCTLEPIPASPIDIEPGYDILTGLEPPPRARQRSRSFSPVGPRISQGSESPLGSTDELHIHPLFRSDSPTPPPMATPGTTVIASPDAGKVIMHRPSNQSLRRVRSGILPAQSSPLSRASSSETFAANKGVEACGSIQEADEEGLNTTPRSPVRAARSGSLPARRIHS
jgi:hypothetical protein